VIARTQFRRVADGEPEQDIHIEIGRPYETATGEWACSIAVRGLHHDAAAMRGEDSFQALALALDLVRRLLQQSVDRGGRFQYPDTSEEVPLEALQTIPHFRCVVYRAFASGPDCIHKGLTWSGPQQQAHPDQPACGTRKQLLSRGIAIG
jgi:hypothetical protein